MSELKVPKKTTQKFNIYLGVGKYTFGEISVTNYNRTLNDDGWEYIFLASKEIEIDIDVPEGFDPRKEFIAVLEAKKEEIKADAHVKLRNVQDKIDGLLQIEYKEVENAAE